MLNKFFEPKSIAIIGVSHNPHKLGFLVYQNIRDGGYQGKIFLVNREGGEIGSLPVHQSVADIKGPIDLALIIVPAIAVPEVLADCAKKKIASAVILSAGFSEAGEEGRKLEEKVKQIAAESKMKVLVPNCLGFINTDKSLNATFASTPTKKSDISVFSQSGAVCSALLDWAAGNNLGFSRFVSVGNKTDIDENEMLDFFEQDKKTRVVAGYLEGIKDGKLFITRLKALTKKKPVIIVKSGKTEKGAKAIASHTGNIAGSDLAVNVALKEGGAIRAETLEDLFSLSKTFSFLPALKSNRVAVVSNAGGPAVLAADAVEQSPLTLAELADKTKKELVKVLPEAASVENPVDVLGDATSDRYRQALKIVARDNGVDAILVILTPQAMTDVEETAVAIRELKGKKPIIVSFMGGEKVALGRNILEGAEVPVFDFPEKAVKALSYLYLNGNKEKEEKGKLPKLDAKKLIPFIKKEGFVTEGPKGALDLLEAAGIKTVLRENIKNLDEAKAAASKIGYPVVLKSAANVLHKTELGGVILNIENENELDDACRKISASEGINVYKMITKGEEVFIGAKRDENFGPLIIFGMGGTMVELLGDFSYRLAPVTVGNAKKMVSEIKGAKILEGYRGEKPLDINGIADCISRISQLMLACPEIKELDINPMLVSQTEAIAVDAKIVFG